jgi:hypothetical protein
LLELGEGTDAMNKMALRVISGYTSRILWKIIIWKDYVRPDHFMCVLLRTHAQSSPRSVQELASQRHSRNYYAGLSKHDLES